jgi:hypothetical protein
MVQTWTNASIAQRRVVWRRLMDTQDGFARVVEKLARFRDLIAEADGWRLTGRSRPAAAAFP